MTAEIFLAALLGALLALIVRWVFVVTVYIPISNALLRRAFGAIPQRELDRIVKRVQGSCDLVSVDDELNPDVQRIAGEGMRRWEAQQLLCLSALDVSEKNTAGLVTAAVAFRDATTEPERRSMRAWGEFQKAQHPEIGSVK